MSSWHNLLTDYQLNAQSDWLQIYKGRLVILDLCSGHAFLRGEEKGGGEKPDTQATIVERAVQIRKSAAIAKVAKEKDVEHAESSNVYSLLS